MTNDIELRVDPQTAASTLRLTAAASTSLGIDANRIRGIRVVRRSIDARQRNIFVNLRLRVYVDQEPPASLAEPVEYSPLPDDAPTAVVVGAGPAGLFASLRLIERGIRPILLERGKDVDRRRPDMAAISRTGVVDPDSNYCFGEGGAGAFSDGKLYTRSTKRGSVDKILNILCQHGASEDILADVHPHIGSDRLPSIIRNIRETIIRCGGEVWFDTRVTSLLTDRADGSTVPEVTGVATADGREFRGPVILATGHSARDTYRMLLDSGATLEPKGIAVGVRLEHPQKLIDSLRYHSRDGRGKWLPPAEYTMLTRVDGRAVYSFCMCPGGFIVPAASAPGELVVNGMSPSNRGTRWANSGMVVEVLPEDIGGDSPLKMMDFQRTIEKRFFEDAGETQNAPAQRMADFVASRESKTLPQTSYAPGIHPARIDRLLPSPIARRLQQGFRDFDRKQRGFLTNEAVLIGAETRTSSPVRIPRNPQTLVHTAVCGLYPAGEGAGYAGGIVSAAIDGERCADALADTLR
ncbi:MAG: hypothetical protein NC336_03745 [Clostridium sp.]|nr:hypothetical protein [Clostridium sp.]